MQAIKRRHYAGIYARKRRAGSMEMRYFLDRRTDWPIVNAVLKEQYNDLRSRLSELPAAIIVFELGPFLAEPRKAGFVRDGQYVLGGEWAVGDGKPISNGALCCNGVNSEIVMVAPVTKTVYIIAPDCTLLRKFSMRIEDRRLIKQAWCVGTYRNGNIAVSDYDDGRIVVFTGDGRFLKTLKKPRNSNAQYVPTTFAIDERDNMYVCNWLEHYITILDSEGAELRSIECGLDVRYPRVHGDYLYAKAGRMGAMLVYNLKSGERVHAYLTNSENRPDMAIDGAGKCVILATEWSNSYVWSATLDNTKSYLEWTRHINTARKSRNMCLDPSGNIWLTPIGGEYKILKYRPPD